MSKKVKCYVCGKNGEVSNTLAKSKSSNVPLEEIYGFSKTKDANNATKWVCTNCYESGRG